MNEDKEEVDMPMRLYGRTNVAEFLGDFMVYRGLNPCDSRLPQLNELLVQAGLDTGRMPRKHELDYARLVAALLRHARRLDVPRSELRRLIFIGDTRLSDVGAFQNLCQVGGWQGLVFIGGENRQPVLLTIEQTSIGYPLYLANRWVLLEEFERRRQELGFAMDETTAVVLDLDKTTLGARGRNAPVIDRVRVQAVRQTVAGLLGESFDPAAFQTAYSRLDQPEFHLFTADNQDYLAYICLVLGSGYLPLADLLNRLQSGEMHTFDQFIAEVEANQSRLPEALRAIHAEIYTNVQRGDPTPFKAFRRNEYRLTAGQMGCLPDDSPVSTILTEEIVITQEVREMALEWKNQGALLFGLSDKPDEASLPTPELARQGWQPLHRTITHSVGQGR